MTIYERIKYIRESLKLSQEEFGIRIGFSKGAISGLEKGTRNITEKHIKLICSEFSVHEDWLKFETGEIFENSSEKLFEQIEKKFDLSNFEKKFLEKYFSLETEKRLVIEQFLDDVFQERNNDKEKTEKEKIDEEVEKYRKKIEKETAERIEEEIYQYRLNLELGKHGLTLKPLNLHNEEK